MKKVCVILRGLPGSGKSTRAAELIKNDGAVVCSMDDYWTRGGQPYKRVPAKWKQSQQFCEEQAEGAFKSGKPLVVIDNTTLKRSTVEHYKEVAASHGYDVRVEVIGDFSEAACKTYAERGIHKVPLDTLKHMASGFEPLRGDLDGSRMVFRAVGRPIGYKRFPYSCGKQTADTETSPSSG